MLSWLVTPQYVCKYNFLQYLKTNFINVTSCLSPRLKAKSTNNFLTVQNFMNYSLQKVYNVHSKDYVTGCQ